MNEYAKFAGPLLVVAGFAYQWVRQWSGVGEKWTVIFATVLACGVYLLCYDFTQHIGWQGVLVNAILWLSEHTASVLGGTFVASSAAKAGVAAVPMTNSK